MPIFPLNCYPIVTCICDICPGYSIRRMHSLLISSIYHHLLVEYRFIKHYPTTIKLILLLNGLGPPIFVIILASTSCITNAFSPIYFMCSLKFNLSSIITLRYLMPPTVTSIFSTIFQPLIKTASVLSATSCQTCLIQPCSIISNGCFFSSFTLTVFVIEIIALSSVRPTIVVPFGNCSISWYILFHSSGSSTEPFRTPAIATYSCYPSSGISESLVKVSRLGIIQPDILPFSVISSMSFISIVLTAFS